MNRKKITALFLVILTVTFFVACTNPISPTVGVNGVTLNKESFGLVVGETETLIATIAPTGASNQDVSWASDNTTIADVDANGKVTGKTVGQTTIKVTTDDGRFTAECGVNVGSLNVVSVALNTTNITLGKDKSYQLIATVLPAYATNKKVTWTTSANTVVRIDADQNGKIFTIAAGTADITATTQDGSKTATCRVTVTQ